MKFTLYKMKLSARKIGTVELPENQAPMYDPPPGQYLVDENGVIVAQGPSLDSNLSTLQDTLADVQDTLQDLRDDYE